jgi:hypothetical protein
VPPQTAIIACDVFQDEILKFLGDASMAEVPLVWLEMGLHDSPDLLRRTIQERIAAVEANAEITTIILAYGLCGNGLAHVTSGRCPLVIPRSHDCISVLLGGPEAHASVLAENPATYFYSPGWIRGRRVPGPDREAHLRAMYGERYPDDEEMVADLIEADTETFAHHNCAAYVDLTDDPDAEDYCRSCARHLDWNFRRLEGNPSLLRDLLFGPWDPDRFLIVPPGRATAIAPDGTLTTA